MGQLCRSYTLKIALCIPTLNAGTKVNALVAAITSQSLRPDAFLVIDSSSSDGTADVFRDAGADVRTIDRVEFNHGATRQLDAGMLSDVELIVNLT